MPLVNADMVLGLLQVLAGPIISGPRLQWSQMLSVEFWAKALVATDVVGDGSKYGKVYLGFLGVWWVLVGHGKYLSGIGSTEQRLITRNPTTLLSRGSLVQASRWAQMQWGMIAHVGRLLWGL